MPKKLISLRISTLTEAQLAELTQKLGMTQTDIVTVAINDYHDKMEEKMKPYLEQLDYAQQEAQRLIAQIESAGDDATHENISKLLGWERSEGANPEMTDEQYQEHADRVLSIADHLRDWTAEEILQREG